ncbi:MAG: tyrosine-type recombinase/integrase, partial [Helicobacteraceae bacterium]|nr:tyrosine-type recombinase/integrase [Helicobacteraceae bacterium]
MADKTKMIRCPKYMGVYYVALQGRHGGSKNDRSYYITYKDPMTNKKKWLKVGYLTEGVNEQYCSNLRSQILVKLRLGDDSPAISRIKKTSLEMSVTLNLAAESYFQDKGKLKDVSRYAVIYEREFAPSFGETPVATLTADNIETYTKKKLEKGLHWRSVRIYIATLEAIINHAVKKKQIKVNPLGIVKRPKDGERERYLTDNECAALLSRCKSDRRLYLFVLLSLSTGARISSVLTIKKQDILLAHGVVNIIDHKTQSRYRGFLSEDVVKQITPDLDALSPNCHIIGGRVKPLSKWTIGKQLQPILNDMFNRGLDKKDTESRT